MLHFNISLLEPGILYIRTRSKNQICRGVMKMTSFSTPLSTEGGYYGER